MDLNLKSEIWTANDQKDFGISDRCKRKYRQYRTWVDFWRLGSGVRVSLRKECAVWLKRRLGLRSPLDPRKHRNNAIPRLRLCG